MNAPVLSSRVSQQNSIPFPITGDWEGVTSAVWPGAPFPTPDKREAVWSTQAQPSELEGQLENARMEFKISVSRVSMHLGLAWLQKLFLQIDNLYDAEEWDPRDPVPGHETARTFIRMLLTLSVDRKPGIGVSNSGRIIAAWTAGANRLTVECLSNDKVRWVLMRELDGEIERAAGEGKIERLQDFLKPYDPSIWFQHG